MTKALFGVLDKASRYTIADALDFKVEGIIMFYLGSLPFFRFLCCYLTFQEVIKRQNIAKEND